MNALDAGLLRRHGAPGPRYTSYPTVPFWDTAPDEAGWLGFLDDALGGDTAGHGASVYVHIPFCQALCTFCGCNMRVARGHGLVPPYLAALRKEWRMLRDRLGRDSIRLGELYLGGGTPTFLHADELDALLSELLAHAPPREGAWLTIEVDPRHTSRAQLEVLRRHGFTNLSLGVQDLDPRVQDIVNRVQSADDVRRVVDEARALNFTGIAFDLIHGLPLQTRDSINATMDAVLPMAPSRISFYPYVHVPWIRASQRRFTEADLPEGDERIELQLLGRQRLAAAGYVEIGMDLFALPSDPLVPALREGRLHRNFMGYSPSHTAPLLGLGVSAIGDAGAAVAQNEKNLQQYQERVERDELPLQRGHVLDAEDRVLRRHILNVTTRFATRWDRPADWTPWLDEVPARLQPLHNDGLVVLEDRGLRITEAGRAFLRPICRAFDARLDRHAAAWTT